MTEPPLVFYPFGTAAVATRREHTYAIQAGPIGWNVHHCDDADQPLTTIEVGIADQAAAERFANTHLQAITTPADRGDTRPVLIAMAQMFAVGVPLVLVLNHLLGG